MQVSILRFRAELVSALGEVEKCHDGISQRTASWEGFPSHIAPFVIAAKRQVPYLFRNVTCLAVGVTRTLLALRMRDARVDCPAFTVG